MSEPVGNTPRIAIPGNSYKMREGEAVAQEQVAEPREKVEKVIEGKVVKRKQPLWKRAARSMIADDAQSVGDFILVDVIIPAAKNLIRDIVVGGTDRALYGSAKARGRVGTTIVGGGLSSLRTRYDKMAEERPRTLSRESRAKHDFDDIVLDDRNEAITVMEELISRVSRFGSASVTDLYDLVGVTGSFTDQRWGWTDLSTADIRQSRGGFLLDLPRPEPLR
jgi:hypothetical protein